MMCITRREVKNAGVYMISAIPYRIRSAIPKPMRRVLRALSYLSVFSDLTSCFLYWKLTQRSLTKTHSVDFVEFRIRQLHGRTLRCRSRGSDTEVVYTTFAHQFHLPGAKKNLGNVSVIFDLGANIGSTMAHFAHLYPAAVIVGVELDHDNAELARFNTQDYPNCQVVEAAVWVQDGNLEYEYINSTESGYSAREVNSERLGTPVRSAKAVTMGKLCNEYAPERMIDYVKMDVEGAERRLLTENTEWAQRVRCLMVELHDYDKDACIRDLQRLGFEAAPDDNHHSAVIGIRPNSKFQS